ncbi:MAG TPA: helix-turn-helix transcriptional regulator [Ligilactobacillus acidipiscis]|uniref:Helix-turn-helix transcriptional regulator n=1 Tax=Ligilactobacillus acidipiscis TaxID=89059 RepID=A0A921F663_9LACO|nr:helix-turn-helix transcriptional regulator [Ligilactobacillus acidipiscis]
MIKNKLKVLRAERNLTQEEFAELFNVSRQTIVSIEKYKYNPSLELALKIARYFNMPLEKIFIYEEEE